MIVIEPLAHCLVYLLSCEVVCEIWNGDWVRVSVSFTVILFGENKMSWVWSFSRFVSGGGGDLNIEKPVLCAHSWLCLFVVFLCCEDGWIDGSGNA